jgi:hypothetical protein
MTKKSDSSKLASMVGTISQVQPDISKHEKKNYLRQ